MDLGLKDRVAIVGGGSKGLGRACADSLAREGTKLAICSRNPEDLATAAQEIRSSTGVDVLAVPGDLSRLEDIQNLVRQTVEHFGRLDVLVANSGGPPEGRAVDTTEETWDCSFQMALSFFIRMGREAVPHMRKQSWGRIVNILASTVYQPIDNLVTSGVTRMGAVAYAKSLADEVGRDNILARNWTRCYKAGRPAFRWGGLGVRRSWGTWLPSCPLIRTATRQGQRYWWTEARLGR